MNEHQDCHKLDQCAIARFRARKVLAIWPQELDYKDYTEYSFRTAYWTFAVKWSRTKISKVVNVKLCKEHHEGMLATWTKAIDANVAEEKVFETWMDSTNSRMLATSPTRLSRLQT